MNAQLATEYTQYYHTTSRASDDPALTAGMTLFVILFSLAISAAVYVLVALFLSRIFKKAGIETWKAWVPFYNNWITLELGNQRGFWAVLAIIPIVNIASSVFMMIAMYHIGMKLGKSGAFVLWAIFLPLVWYIWLAVDKSTWKEHAAEKPAARPPRSHTPEQTA